MYVRVCNAVTDHEIRGAVKLGVRTLDDTALRNAIAQCEKVGDYVSPAIEEILESEVEHIDFLETQVELIGKVGLENYLQSQMGNDDAKS